MQNLKWDKEKDSFSYGKQCIRVTTSVSKKQLGDFTLIDTPGTNDFQSELSDYEIQKMKHESLGQFFGEASKGISTILQCISIDAGGRLKETSYESMAGTLHSLMYSFPDYDEEKGGPQLCVILTKFSRYAEDIDDIMIDGLESEGKYSTKNRFKELIRVFKEKLSSKMYYDLHEHVPLERIERKIDHILPDENFYAFNIPTGNKEQLEVER